MKRLFLIIALTTLPFTARADCVSAECTFQKGNEYFMERDYPKAEDWLLRAAEQGHGQAQIRLGFMYGEHHFDGVEDNLEKAEYWLTKAANQNAEGGKFRLGNFYQHYQKPPDYQKSAYWLKKSADDNDYGSAQYDLARLYLSDHLGPADHAKGEHYLNLAAEKGLKQAQIALVTYYEEHGQIENALKWAEQLAKTDRASSYWQGKANTLRVLIE